MTVAVKICGILQAEHALVALNAGADYLGLVFAPSRREITPDQARVLVATVRAHVAQLGRTVGVVGVFVNEDPGRINEIAADVGLDYAQLSGHEAVATADAITHPVIKAIRFDDHLSEAAWLASCEPINGHVPALLVDAHVPGSFGGAGVTGDWQQAARLAQQRSIWLAGGLTPDNVAAAVGSVRPQVVDVSSGVETAGVKDPAKIVAFVRAAKSVSTPHDLIQVSPFMAHS